MPAKLNRGGSLGYALEFVHFDLAFVILCGSIALSSLSFSSSLCLMV